MRPIDPRTPALDRREAVRWLLSDRGDLLVVTGLGAATYDVAATGDHERTFYTWGAMGCAAMIGLGLALAKPRARVLVVTGDGEMLMALGSLATIGNMRPENLSIAVLDNGVYGETGQQPSHTRGCTSLATVASGCGFAVALNIDDPASVASFREIVHHGRGPSIGVIRIQPEPAARVLPIRDGIELKIRFRRAVVGGS